MSECGGAVRACDYVKFASKKELVLRGIGGVVVDRPQEVTEIRIKIGMVVGKVEDLEA